MLIIYGNQRAFKGVLVLITLRVMAALTRTVRSTVAAEAAGVEKVKGKGDKGQTCLRQ